MEYSGSIQISSSVNTIEKVFYCSFIGDGIVRKGNEMNKKKIKSKK